MVSKIDQLKFGIWNTMHEYRLSNEDIAKYTGFTVEEVTEFLNR